MSIKHTSLTDLEEATVLGASDLLYVVQNNQSLKCTVDALSVLLTGNTVKENRQGAYKGVQLEYTSITAGTGNTSYPVWDSVVRDVGGFYSASNPGVVTIPAGVTKVQVFCTVLLKNPDLEQPIHFRIRKNSTIMATGTSFCSINPELCQAFSPVIEVTAGDTIDVQFENRASANPDAVPVVGPGTMLEVISVEA